MNNPNPNLTVDPLFVGATRPPMRWGVTYAALLFNLVFTIVENCGNTLILRCSGSDDGGTSHFASRLIGEREIVRRQTSRGRDREGSFIFKGSRHSTSVSEQHVIEAAVMPSELEQLPDLSGFLKTASSRAWRRVRIARQPR